MLFKSRTIDTLADLICGNFPVETSHFPYRSSMYLTKFFQDCDTDYAHDGSTRAAWVGGVLIEILAGPQQSAQAVPTLFAAVIKRLMDQEEATNEGADRTAALAQLNATLQREGFEAFYAEDRQCYLRHLKTRVVSGMENNPHRPLSKQEIEKRAALEAFIEHGSEDQLIEEVLLPLFRHLGFQRITPAGHSDKALEYGKDIWMKYRLPTMHWLYFGVQAKRGKLDSSGVTKGSNANVAEILNQLRMMLGHAIFDPEVNHRVLVDHALLVAGGEITKQARNWLGEQLDASARSQVLFMQRSDILDLFVVNSLPVPALPNATSPVDDDIPF